MQPHSVRPRIFALILSIKGCMQSNSISIKMHRIAVFLLPLVALSSSEFTCPSPYAAVEPVVGQCQCARLVASPWRNQVRLHLLTLLLAQKQFKFPPPPLLFFQSEAVVACDPISEEPIFGVDRRLMYNAGEAFSNLVVSLS